MENIFKNIVGSYKHIPYTWKHYLAFLKVEHKYLGYYKYKFHDWDKLFLFIFFPYLGERRINQIHQEYQPHHPTYTVGSLWTKNYKRGKDVRWDEAVIDWECARLTKPDKPLDAYGTMKKYYPEYREYVEPVLKSLGLWNENNIR